MNIGTGLFGAGLGAALMYIFDPQTGKRRVAVARDKVIHGGHKFEGAAIKVWHDGVHRMRGIVMGSKSKFFSNGANDQILFERVRAQLGRLVRHPGSVQVTIEQGKAILTGPVLTDELEPLIEKIRHVKGVKGVENRLVAYRDPSNVPGLQGSGARREERPELLQENWAPSIRFLAGATGATAVIYGRGRGGLFGSLFTLGGLYLLVRGLTNRSVTNLTGLEEGATIDIKKTINIAAPIEHVFNLWCDFDNFPKFMSFVREVKETDVETGVTHWKVKGPAGVPIEWDAFVTDIVDNELLSWKTVPGSIIKHEGSVRFGINPDGSTQVDVRLRYNPGLGAIGHAVAKLFGADPKARMDEDLMRMKTFIEEQRQPHDAAQKTAPDDSGGWGGTNE